MAEAIGFFTRGSSTRKESEQGAASRGEAIVWREAPGLRVVRAVAGRLADVFGSGLLLLDHKGDFIFPQEHRGVSFGCGSERNNSWVSVMHGDGIVELSDVSALFRMQEGSNKWSWRVFRLQDETTWAVGVPVVLSGALRGAVFAVGFCFDKDVQKDAQKETKKDTKKDTKKKANEDCGWEVHVERERIGMKLPWYYRCDGGRWDVGMLNRALELLHLVAEEVDWFKEEVDSRERRRKGRYVPGRERFSEIIGESSAMMHLFRTLGKVAESDSTVLICGENGTGKELVARSIHANSKRGDFKFIAQNSSALNDNLLESELFGHVKGAFTGAVSDKVGLFEVAHQGTFFLDEVGEMSPNLQVKLLRVLQEGTFIPVGGTEPRRVDVRILAATNRDLEKMVEAGEFREDLYYRLNVIVVQIPSLRERKEDIPLLIDHFFKIKSGGSIVGAKRLSERVIGPLVDYEWPGNVRELENELERLFVMAGDEKIIDESLLSPRILERQPERLTVFRKNASSMPAAVEELEREMIRRALKKHHWNKSQAARELEISRRNLLRKVKRYDLDRRKGGRV